ncbi:hypothetical protein ACJX0J_032479, partial [Zea mays]
MGILISFLTWRYGTCLDMFLIQRICDDCHAAIIEIVVRDFSNIESDLYLAEYSIKCVLIPIKLFNNYKLYTTDAEENKTTTK